MLSLSFWCKTEARQLTVVNYGEPEELTGGISEMDDTEMEWI